MEEAEEGLGGGGGLGGEEHFRTVSGIARSLEANLARMTLSASNYFKGEYEWLN